MKFLSLLQALIILPIRYYTEDICEPPTILHYCPNRELCMQLFKPSSIPTIGWKRSHFITKFEGSFKPPLSVQILNFLPQVNFII